MSELPLCAYCDQPIRRPAARTCGDPLCRAKASREGAIRTAEIKRGERLQREAAMRVIDVDFSPFNIDPPDDIGTVPMRPPTVVSRQASS